MADASVGIRGGPARVPSRLLGLGSVFGKSIRDGRRVAVIVALLVTGMMIAGGAAMAAEWDTVEERLALAAQMELLPEVLQGVLGEPIALDTLGGFLSWRFGNILQVILGIWSVTALSSTLAGEAARGTLDLVVASPVSRRWIAAQKALGHVSLVALAMLAAAVITWVATIVFAVLPGDEISLVQALSHFTMTGLIMLAAGGAAFAAAPILGRGRALGIGMAVLFGGFLVSSYGGSVPALGALDPLSVFAWTADHRPMAGQYDWVPVAGVGLLAAAFLVAGVVAFDRRDIGATAGPGPIRLPALPAGTGGPLRRQLADRAGAALGWGIGIGAYALILALSADAFAEGIGSQPSIQRMIAVIYPGIDLADPTGVVQLAFFAFGSLMIGLAATVLVAGWAADEGERRLDLVLAAPISRFRWASRSGAGLLIAIAAVAAIIGAAIAIGVASQGGEVGNVAGGTLVLALFGTAYGGVGLLVGGMFGTRFAAPAAGGLVIASFLLELLGRALNLPDWLVDLALNGHLGQPLLGTYDVAGLVACVTLTAGGLVGGALGWRLRDVGR